MSRTRRDREFSQRTKNDLAKRANYLCSNPNCRKPTLSPSRADAQGAALIGEAAHICGAGAGAARYDPRQSDEECRSIANGIWLCATCATLIDKNDGADYSADLLREWKQVHEKWITAGCPQPEALTVVDGTHVARGSGIVTGLDIRRPVIIKPGTLAIAEGDGEVTATRIGGE
jgi:hypothetical protein